MFKKKVILILALVLNLSFPLSKFCFASEFVQNQTLKYNDEFAGKDKHEKFNRKLYTFNSKLNKYVLRPIDTLWCSIMPQYAMDRFQNLYNNINFPVRVVSCMLEKDFKSSGTEFVRFLANTTIGIGGLYDPATSVFKIEPHNESIEQVLGNSRIKPGPYIVLPVVQGNMRDLAGKFFDMILRPTSYIPYATTASFINSTANSQDKIKRLEESNADPYEVAKLLKGLDEYIKINKLDRKTVLAQKEELLNTENDNVAENNNMEETVQSKIAADINLDGYAPQGPLVDSLRSTLFDNEKIDKSIWSETAIWNRTFSKRLRFASVNIDKSRPSYKYRYILQKDKTAPLAIIYPELGEGIWGDKSIRQAKILYNEGYSVVIQGNAFNWEFVRSMPGNYKPGIPSEDAQKLRIVTSRIINNLEIKKKCQFSKKILVGNSFGALTALFVASQEDMNNTLGITNYIVINPPIDAFFALKQLDKFSQIEKNSSGDAKLRIAIAAQKIKDITQNKDYKNAKYGSLSMPFNNDEAKLVIGCMVKQKLYDVIFTIENCKKSKKNNLYESIGNINFTEYTQKYLQDFVTASGKTPEQLGYEASLYSLAAFLQKSKNYKIYHSIDDYFINSEQLAWLKQQAKDNVVIFSNGSHLGFLYRPEFLEQFKKDINFHDV